jgi:hypothetical protein
VDGVLESASGQAMAGAYEVRRGSSELVAA